MVPQFYYLLHQRVMERVEAAPFPRYFLNSFVMSAGVAACVTLTSALAAYAFAFLDFPGRRGLFAAFVGTLITALIAAGVGVLSWDSWGDWKPVLWACGVAALTVVVKALNWKDPSYGAGA